MMNWRTLVVANRMACLALLGSIAMPASTFATITNPGAFQTAAQSTGTLLAQEGPFQRRMRERRERKFRQVEQELEQNPSLINDPHYLAQHPKLAEYLKRHPEAKGKIEKNPKAFFRHFNTMMLKRADQ